jgi:WhiB family redox-sensing transcriptional regulator
MSEEDEWTPPEHLPWMDEALCAQTDPDMFFPEKGGSARSAKRVCASCDVREQCLDYALATGQTEGVWGGLTPRQRRATGRFIAQPNPRVDYAEVALWVERGFDDQEVAAKVGCAPETVMRWRHRHGIEPNSHGGRSSGRSWAA